MWHVWVSDSYETCFVSLRFSVSWVTGSHSSCISMFSIMPFFQCLRDGTCQLGVRADRSYWLATTEPLPMMPLDVVEVRRRVARCVICEAPTQPYAFHAQGNQLHDVYCPNGWSELWNGYSFVMVSCYGYIRKCFLASG